MEKTIEIKISEPTLLFGIADANIKEIVNRIPVKVIIRDQKIKLSGPRNHVKHASLVFFEMMETLNATGKLTFSDVDKLITLSDESEKNIERANSKMSKRVIYYGRNGEVITKNSGQDKYFDCVKTNDIVFSIGPAGTGKTFLSVAFAVSALEQQIVDRIILSRPAVEAGESLGFLPGDFKEKVDPYLAPLYDSLHALYHDNKLLELLENKIIEIIPLAYMRGRTLNNAFIILDEAQNATAIQMKMFLTRLGIGSKAIINGDVTQIDLKNSSDSGLIQASSLLKSVKGIGIVNLDNNDIVRHPLVMKIIQAYGSD